MQLYIVAALQSKGSLSKQATPDSTYLLKLGINKTKGSDPLCVYPGTNHCQYVDSMFTRV